MHTIAYQIGNCFQPHLLAARHDSTGQVVEAATDGLIALDPDLLESTLLNLFDDSTPADRTKAAARGLARLGSAVAKDSARLVAALETGPESPDLEVELR